MSFLVLEPASQPEWMTEQLRAILRPLTDVHTEEAWMREVADLREKTETWIGAGTLTGPAAAPTLFLVHALEAAWAAEGKAGAAIVLGFAIQMTLSNDDWSRFLAATEANGASGDGADDGPLRIGLFPARLLDYLIKRRRLSIIRELYRLVHPSVDGLARRAMRESRDFDAWISDLANLAAHLVMRRWLPLTIAEESAGPGKIELFAGDDSEIVGGRFVAPPHTDNPFLAHLFDEAEILTLHRREAYAAECFAHLYSSVMAEWTTSKHQDEMTAEYHRRMAQSSLDARQWAALGKSRFKLAPYIPALVDSPIPGRRNR